MATGDSYFRVPIVHFNNPNSKHISVFTVYNYYGFRVYERPNELIAIQYDGLPNVDRLIRSYKASDYTILKLTGPFRSLQAAFLEFTKLYCGKKCQMPLVKFPT
jgi:hypothetical protein